MPLQQEILLYETASGKERLQIAPNDKQVKQIAFSPDGHVLASAGQGSARPRRGAGSTGILGAVEESDEGRPLI